MRLSLGRIFAAASLVVVSFTINAAVVTVPNANTSTLGNGQGFGPLHNNGTGGSRYQQVYSSAQFGGFSASESITAIAFRAKQAALGTFIGKTVSVSDILIKLSTTSKTDVGGLDATFANNIGADAKTVYAGSLTMTASNPGSTNVDYTITLQSPFTYSKALGNLLLDVTIPDNATVSSPGASLGYSQFDTVTDTFPSADGISSASGATAGGDIGSNSTTGVVTRFTSTAVPEPAALGALSVLSALVIRRHK